MKINRKLWWIPIIGIIHIVRNGIKYGFYNNIDNLTGKEALLGCVLHAVSIVTILFLLIII
jgi:hypothetical protein